MVICRLLLATPGMFQLSHSPCSSPPSLTGASWTSTQAHRTEEQREHVLTSTMPDVEYPDKNNNLYAAQHQNPEDVKVSRYAWLMAAPLLVTQHSESEAFFRALKRAHTTWG